jgi:uncharacterized protein DUF2490
MPGMLNRIGIAALAMVSIYGIPAASAPTKEEFWPEFDAFFKLDDRTRLLLMTAATRGEDTTGSGGSTKFENGQVGAHLDFTLRPFLRTDLRDKDWEHNRYLWMRVGYRYLQDFSDWSSGENRGILELNARQPLTDEFSLTGRLKWELRDIDGDYSNRYGVRFGAERPFAVGGRTSVPYANVEILYDSRFDTWNRQRYEAGIEIAINGRWQVQPYFAHQDDNRSNPAHLNALGLTLKYSQ